MTEHWLTLGRQGSLCWVLTNRRLVLAHTSWVPVPRLSRSKFAELRAWGWKVHEIARMYWIEDVRHLQTFVRPTGVGGMEE